MSNLRFNSLLTVRLLLFLVGAAVLLQPLRAGAQGTLSMIFSNGPLAKRINVVVLSEGYTTNQLGQFLTDAAARMNILFTNEPFAEYKPYFNAFAISVPSVQPGSDHPKTGSFRDTYFNSAYDITSDYVITIPADSTGLGKVNTLVTNLLPEADLMILLVNDSQPGGSGGTNLVVTSLNPTYPEILAHECGHTFGKLADEYTNALTGFVPVEKPNATAITNRASLKWAAWVSTNTPIATPEDVTNETVVGVFRGAEYQTTGWYRPKMDCKMKDINTAVDFCEVCREQIVRSVYTLVRPVESFLPASTNFSVYSTQALAFSLTTLQPASHDLSIQWFTNNVAVAGQTNDTFTALPKIFSNGTHTVRSVVMDPTVFVRSDPTNFLKQTNTWTLNVSLNDLSIIASRYLATNKFRLTVTGAAPQGFVILGSSNLVNWTPLTTNSLSGGKFDYTNSGLTNLAQRYYRTLSPP